MATFDPQIVKSTGYFHGQIRKAFLCVTENVLHNPAALDACNRVLNHNPCSRNDAVQPVVYLTQLLAFQFFLGWNVITPFGSYPWKPVSLPRVAPFG